jgi:heat shock protein HslJ
VLVLRIVSLTLFVAAVSLASISCGAQHKPAQSAPSTPPGSLFVLGGSEWLLVDLAGGGVLDRVQATLSFPEGNKIAGSDSCNQFFGTAEVSGNTLKLTPLGTTRMACPEDVMNQETKYLAALRAAERYEWKYPYLLIYCKGFDKPLRFARLASPKPSPRKQGV